MRLPERLRGAEPPLVLGTLVVVQWAAVAVFALRVQRNGWLYYQGGDQLWHYTSAWFLAQGELVLTAVGFAWPLVLTPIAAAAGPSMLDALPAIVLFQVIVLLPVALFAIYTLGARLGGRAVGYGGAVIWVAAPWLAIPLFDESYHVKYVEQFLPQALGLTVMSDFPSTVALLVGAALAVRAFQSDDVGAGAGAGLALGIALAVKPSLALVLPAVALAFVLARSPRGLLGGALGLVPPLLALAVWKYRGVGDLPVLASPEVRVAAGIDLTAPLEEYLGFDFENLRKIERDLRGVFWSARLLEFLPLAGIVALARRSLPGAVLLGGWFLTIVVAKGASTLASVDSGSFFRLVMPAFPAFCVLAAAILLVVPSLGGRLAAAPQPEPVPRRRLAREAAALGAACVAALLVFALVRPLSDAAAARYPENGPPVPVLDRLELAVREDVEEVVLSWRPAEEPTRVFYRVFRGRGDGLDCSDDGGAVDCKLAMEPIGETRELTFRDQPPSAGRWVYRVGVAANYLDDSEGGDPIWFSGPAAAVTR